MEHRTQIHLSQSDYRRALRYAEEHQLSLAGVVREALGEYLSAREGARAALAGPDPIDGLVGLLGNYPRLREGAHHDQEIVDALEEEVSPSKVSGRGRVETRDQAKVRSRARIKSSRKQRT
jgi:hypothetical protein